MQCAVAAGADWEVVTSGFSKPWGLAFDPGGRPLVTEVAGRLWRVNGKGEKRRLTLLPVDGLTNLLDIEVCSDRIYWSAQTKRGLVVFQSQFSDGGTADSKVVFTASEAAYPQRLVGGRLFSLDCDTLLVSVGDSNEVSQAQNRKSLLGKIVRVANLNAEPKVEVIALGLRNVQGFALSGRGILFIDHGGFGSDTLNLLVEGENYGWPNGERPIPVAEWTPAVAPSSLAVSGDRAFVGSLVRRALVQIQLSDPAVDKEELLLAKLGQRIRNVETSPDGFLFALTDDGLLVRVTL